MKVPEKILITQDEDTKELSEHWCLGNLTNNPHIEYINKDAFIEKAWDWIEDNILSSNQQDKSLLYYEQFKKLFG